MLKHLASLLLTPSVNPIEKSRKFGTICVLLHPYSTFLRSVPVVELPVRTVQSSGRCPTRLHLQLKPKTQHAELHVRTTHSSLQYLCTAIFANE